MLDGQQVTSNLLVIERANCKLELERATEW